MRGGGCGGSCLVGLGYLDSGGRYQGTQRVIRVVDEDIRLAEDDIREV